MQIGDPAHDTGVLSLSIGRDEKRAKSRPNKRSESSREGERRGRLVVGEQKEHGEGSMQMVCSLRVGAG